MIGFFIILSILAVVVLYFVVAYNGLIRLRNQVKNSWSQIDVQLKRRHDLIPNLVETAKGYMQHERVTLESLTKARSLLVEAKTLSRKAAVDNVISNLLKTVFAVAENYPDLKAGENFLKLQKRITGLENELADRREFYNDSVTIYNIRILGN